MAYTPATKKRVRIQSSHSDAARGLDAYFSPYEAIWPLIDLEGEFMPSYVWEPSAGDGRIVRCLEQSNIRCIASDLANYHARGVDIQTGVDYLKAVKPKGVRGIVTNPPYKHARAFVQKAMNEVGYHAWLLRLNFLEAEGRIELFKENPPARVMVSSRRLPMMHRLGWEGPTASSNACYAWFVWDDAVPMEDRGKLSWFDWKDHFRDVDTGY